MRIFLISIFTLVISTQWLFSQIEVKITKVSTDSFDIEFPSNMDLEMGKNYQFVFKTNFSEKEGYKENFTDELLYDGLVVNTDFNYHEFGFSVYSSPKKDHSDIHDSKMIYIKGTRYIVKIDGVEISRYNPNSITPKSSIAIELFSNTEDVKNLVVNEPVILSWMGNNSYTITNSLANEKASFDLIKEKQFKKGSTGVILLLLPQVYKDGNELLPKNDQERMYLISYKD